MIDKPFAAPLPDVREAIERLTQALRVNLRPTVQVAREDLYVVIETLRLTVDGGPPHE